MPQGSAATGDRRGVLAACASGAVAMAAYFWTLAPGLTSDADSPMFQFVGKVLGTAHNPGYPLYVLLTHPLAYLPIGSLAWRVNAFSAVMGGVAVALACLAARGLGCRPLVSAAAALGFAFGATFWSQAVIAEVYTLHAALCAGLLAAAFAWRISRRPRDWYLAVACLAAGLGHHTTIAAFAPALALYGLLVDRAFVLRVRTLVSSAAILALGLAPYLLVIVRSRDPHAYLESRASTLADLGQVILARQFQNRLFTESWTHALTARGPVIAERVFAADLTIPGLCLAALGAVWLSWRRPADALLPGIGAAIVTAFAVNYTVVDTPVFLIPALLCVWLFAAAGGEWVFNAVEGPTATRRWAFGVALVALPLWVAGRHAEPVDRHRDRHDAAQLDRLFDVLPDRSAVVGGDFIADRMIHYELLGREAARGRDVRIAPRDTAALRGLHESERRVFAFPGAVDRLRWDGFDFSAAPVRLVDGTLDALVADLPNGSIVALAVPARHARAFAATAPATCSMLSVAGLDGVNAVVAGTVGDSRDTRAIVTPNEARQALRSDVSPWTGLRWLDLTAAGTGAVIGTQGRDVVRTSDGVAVAIWAADGKLVRAIVLQARDGFQVPVVPGAFAAYPLLGMAAEQPLAPGAWVDVTALAGTGSLSVIVPRGAALELRASDDAPLAPSVADSAGRGPVDVRTYAVPANPARGNLPRATCPEQVAPSNQPCDGPGWTSRVTIGAPETPVSVFLTLGGIPSRVVGRVTSSETEPARVRGAGTTGLLRGPDARSLVVRMTRDDQSRVIGAGWLGVESDATGPFRWMAATEARLVLPAAGLTPRLLRLEGFLANADGPSEIALVANHQRLPAQKTQVGWHAYEWEVPAPLAAALVGAPAELTIAVDRLGPPAPGVAPRGLAIASLRLAD
jgi:transmembrane protein TMEM260 (protein O-mannosyltransferase)